MKTKNLVDYSRGHSLKVLELGEIDKYSKNSLMSLEIVNKKLFANDVNRYQEDKNIPCVNTVGSKICMPNYFSFGKNSKQTNLPKQENKKMFMDYLEKVLINKKFNKGLNEDKDVNSGTNVKLSSTDVQTSTLNDDMLKNFAEIDNINMAKLVESNQYSYIDSLDKVKNDLKGGSPSLASDKFKLFKKKLTKYNDRYWETTSKKNISVNPTELAEEKLLVDSDSQTFEYIQNKEKIKIISGENIISSIDPDKFSKNMPKKNILKFRAVSFTQNKLNYPKSNLNYEIIRDSIIASSLKGSYHSDDNNSLPFIDNKNKINKIKMRLIFGNSSKSNSNLCKK
jgi:hypothetical protein